MAEMSDGYEGEALDPANRFVSHRGTLNQDPHNMRAEALAMEMCMNGAGECRTWSEQEMVFTFGGGEVPGTPDFMYEDQHGVLTCGQVVRVPLVRGMSRTMISETVYCTVLTKLIKSQVWMQSCCIIPDEFIIFLWLPFFIHRRRQRLAEALAVQVQNDGWPFRLRFAVPDHPEALFPPMFAASLNPRAKKFREVDLANFDPSNFQQEEEDLMEWDIFAFEDTIETEDIMDENESSESEQEPQADPENFFQENGHAFGEDIAGQIYVNVVMLGSSPSRNTQRGARDKSGPRRLHPLDVGLETWDAKPGVPNVCQGSRDFDFPCRSQSIHTLDAEPPRHWDVPGFENRVDSQMQLCRETKSTTRCMWDAKPCEVFETVKIGWASIHDISS